MSAQARSRVSSQASRFWVASVKRVCGGQRPEVWWTELHSCGDEVGFGVRGRKCSSVSPPFPPPPHPPSTGPGESSNRLHLGQGVRCRLGRGKGRAAAPPDPPVAGLGWSWLVLAGLHVAGGEGSPRRPAGWLWLWSVLVGEEDNGTEPGFVAHEIKGAFVMFRRGTRTAFLKSSELGVPFSGLKLLEKCYPPRPAWLRG